MLRYDQTAVVTIDMLRMEMAQKAAQQTEAVAKLMDETIHNYQKGHGKISSPPP